MCAENAARHPFGEAVIVGIYDERKAIRSAPEPPFTPP